MLNARADLSRVAVVRTLDLIDFDVRAYALIGEDLRLRSMLSDLVIGQIFGLSRNCVVTQRGIAVQSYRLFRFAVDHYMQ